ncbi:hypothetical protein ES703_45122 [subsurface metagenome]
MKYKEIIKGIKSIMKIKLGDPAQVWVAIVIILAGVIWLIYKIG